MLYPGVMMADDPLYQSWMITGTSFNRMLDCGDLYNQWVQNALEYLPRDVLDEHKDRLAFLAMAHRDGCRLARALRENREIIILSEHILPKAGASEGQADVRYFIYTVLHEVVHAGKRHRSPFYDSLTPEEATAQESEADDLALKWFNGHISVLGNPYLPPLTWEDVDAAKAKSQAAMERLYRGL
jgi:hypothetical protein